MTSSTTARRGSGAMLAPKKEPRDHAEARREPPLRSERFDGPAMIGEILRRQASMADQQARDAWMLEALAEKVSRLGETQVDTLAKMQTRLEDQIRDELRAASAERRPDEALSDRVDRIGHAVASLLRGLEADRARLQGEVAKLAETVEARAVEREKRLAEAASNKLIARSEAFVSKPTETVAAIVVKAVEDLGGALRREADEREARLGAMIKAAAADVSGPAFAARLDERFEAQERAERRRAGALSARLEAGLTAHAATLAAATERLDAMFDRLDRLDARTEDLAAATAGVEDWAERINEAVATAASGLRESVAADVAGSLRARLDDEIVPRLRETVSDDVAREMTQAVRTEVSSQVSQEVPHQVAERVRRETAASFAPLEAELTRHARNLADLREAITALPPLQRSAARVDALMDRLGELPLEVERAAERRVGPDKAASALAAELAADFANALPGQDDRARLTRLAAPHDLPAAPRDFPAAPRDLPLEPRERGIGAYDAQEDGDHDETAGFARSSVDVYDDVFSERARYGDASVQAWEPRPSRSDRAVRPDAVEA